MSKDIKKENLELLKEIQSLLETNFSKLTKSPTVYHPPKPPDWEAMKGELKRDDLESREDDLENRMWAKKELEKKYGYTIIDPNEGSHSSLHKIYWREDQDGAERAVKYHNCVVTSAKSPRVFRGKYTAGNFPEKLISAIVHYIKDRDFADKPLRYVGVLGTKEDFSGRNLVEFLKIMTDRRVEDNGEKNFNDEEKTPLMESYKPTAQELSNPGLEDFFNICRKRGAKRWGI